MTKKQLHDPARIVSGQDYFLAKNRWDQFWYEQGIEMQRFNKFLGFSGKGGFSSVGTYYMRGSAVTKIEKLAGPNYYVLLKAYQHRKHLHRKQK